MSAVGPELLGSLFDEHASALGLYARSWTDAPEDIVQEAFIKLARQKVAPDRPVAWLYKVVRNEAVAQSRSIWRRRRREALVSSGESLVSSPDDRLDAAHVSAMLQDLQAENREVIVARLWGGLTFEEIAKLQGCSVATAHRRYQTGLELLHERIEPSWTARTS